MIRIQAGVYTERLGKGSWRNVVKLDGLWYAFDGAFAVHSHADKIIDVHRESPMWVGFKTRREAIQMHNKLLESRKQLAENYNAAMEQGYTINERGFITNPGKFEGEHWSTLLFYDQVMNGFSDESWVDDWDTTIDQFALTRLGMIEYGLGHHIIPNHDSYFVTIWTDDSGFVNAAYWTTDQEPDYTEEDDGEYTRPVS